MQKAESGEKALLPSAFCILPSAFCILHSAFCIRFLRREECKMQNYRSLNFAFCILNSAFGDSYGAVSVHISRIPAGVSASTNRDSTFGLTNVLDIPATSNPANCWGGTGRLK